MPRNDRAVVLVLEPDAAIQKLLNVLLPRSGFDPLFVPDGRTALQELTGRSIAAFLVDVTTAPSTLEEGAFRGIGFLRRLEREHPALLRRVIVMSGLPPARLARELPPVCRFVQKPFEIDELLAALRSCVTQRLAS